tara:strand:+ start:2150 stop:2383 length:234 start_codon:yes stop_codon:yes gene_type:complete
LCWCCWRVSALRRWPETLSPGIAIAVAAAAFHIAVRGSRRRGFTDGACVTVPIVLLALLGSVGSIVDPRFTSATPSS